MNTVNQSWTNRDEPVEYVAASWTELLERRSLTGSEQRKLAKWLIASPKHVEELLFASALLRDLEGIDPARTISVDELLSGYNIEHFPNRNSSGGRETRRWTRAWQAAAAAALLVVSLLLVTLFVDGWEFSEFDDSSHFVTDVGEQRSIVLDDGSLVHMNTRTTLRVSMNKLERSIYFESGEAMFEVARDESRPFNVAMPETIITVLGTSFNVYKRPEAVQVSVLKGRVSVTPVSGDELAKSPPVSATTIPNNAESSRVTLNEGEQIAIAPGGEMSRVEPTDITSVSAWRDRRLIFSDQAVSRVVEEVNRYNRAQIHVQDQRLADVRITAVLDVDSPESLVEMLKVSHDVVVKNVDSGDINMWMPE